MEKEHKNWPVNKCGFISGKGERSLEAGSEISGSIQGELSGAVTGVYLILVICLVSSLDSWCLGYNHFSQSISLYKVKVKVTLVQALRLCTGRTAHRGSRGIALPFHDHGTRRG